MDSSVLNKLDEFFSKFPSYKFKKGDIIIQAGEEPAGIFYIKEGIVRQYWISENGSEITLNLFKPHAFLPMSWAIGNISLNHFFEAMTNEVITHRAPKDVVLSFLKQEPDVMYDLLRRIYIGMEGLWSHIESLTAGNSNIKLISSLVLLAKRFGKKQSSDLVIELKMSEYDIANYAGLSRETTSRELQKLKKDNLVNFEKGVITIHNVHQLEGMLLQ